ncbi:SRPBCC family protein [Iamia majanohamensis]|uniref:SRPBCC family protein n=1 Tax=Iamia majanohamensis TaxID=467976 RepID=A0AAF0BVH7_9ACTN|nr:SRPBCC family protein [Iamia majanohamensis]WCO67043.1 SRPBCC family protein [Iamia majanohamensis]
MTTTSHPETTLTLDDDLPVVRITREFDAPPAQVFRAHVDPDLVVRWMGPRDLEMHIETWECRTGGAYRFLHAREGEEHWFHGSFHDVRPDEVIIQTFTYEGMPDSVSLERLELEDIGGGRTRLVTTSMADSFEARDAMVSSGMEHGVREGYERLDEVLAG